MMNETIAQLTGKLKFDVDSSGLNQFFKKLDQAAKKMEAVGKKAEALATKMKLAPDTRKLDQAAKKAERANQRQHRGEKALEQQRRKTFAAELKNQKLQYSGLKDNAKLQTAAQKQAISNSVLMAKAAHKAAQEAPVKRGRPANTEAQLTNEKMRQAKLEGIVAQLQQRAQKAQAEHVLAMTKAQRLQLGIQEAQERMARQGRLEQERFKARQVAEARRAEVHNQRQQKFQWQQARQQHWDANKDASKGSFSGITAVLGRFGGALTVAGAAVFALGQAATFANERIKERQEGASQAEQYGNLFQQIGGKDKTMQDRSRKDFAQLADKYGTTNNLESAKAFRTFMLSESAKPGYDYAKSLKLYENQLAAFRASGMNKQEQERAVIQLQQVRAIGKADTEDVKTFAEAAPLLKAAIVEAWAERTKFAGKNRDGAFMESIPKGKVLREDFEAGMALFVQQQQDALQRQMKSIEAQQTRLDNQKFLSETGINESEELKVAIAERIAAEKDLAKALEPLKTTLAEFDTALTQAATWLLKLATPRSKEEEAKRQESRVEGDPTKVAAAPATSVSGNLTYAEPPTTWYGKLWDMATAGAEHRQLNKLTKDVQAPGDITINADFSSALDGMKANKPETPIIQPPALPDYSVTFGAMANNAKDTAARPTVKEQTAMQQAAQSVTNNTENTQTITVESPQITIELNGVTDPGAFAQQLEPKMKDIAERTLYNAFERARARQKDIK